METSNLINYSDVESNRFNLKIFRAKLEDVKQGILKKELINNNADLLILRLPSANKSLHSKLLNIGFDVIHADTLVYYTVNLTTYEVKPLRNDITFEIIDDSNISVLKEIIPIIFQDYQNHYFSNPILDKGKITEGYIEWASSYYNQDGKISWLVKKDGQVAGFATCSCDDENKESEGVLYGVMPNFAGKGIYSDMIKYTQQFFKDGGYRSMWVSTQIQNYSVQKAWLNEGFFLKKSFETYHINALLNYSIEPKQVFEFKVTAKDILEFADFSGDKNPLHFDDSYANEMGFKGRIAHGMIFQSYLSKFFGVDYPGKGTIFLKNANMFIAPIYPDLLYKCEISTYSKDKSTGIIKVVAKVFTENNEICAISYNDLMNKNIKD
jgi:acyl dehydratase/GNAT superfamily N-acetyltransferase